MSLPATFWLQMAETQLKMAEAKENIVDDLTGRDKNDRNQQLK